MTFKQVLGFLFKFSMSHGCRRPIRLCQASADFFMAIFVIAPDPEGSRVSTVAIIAPGTEIEGSSFLLALSEPHVEWC